MKKILTLVIVLAMILTLSANVFAAEITNNQSGSNSASADVKVTVNSYDNPVVYYVDVAWSSLDFTYNGGFRTWTPVKDSNHGYADTNGGWGENRDESVTGTVTVTNHSNTDINVATDVNIVDQEHNVGVTCELTQGDAQLAAPAENTAWDTAEKATYTITVSGTPSGITEETTVATVKVSIS